MDADPGVFEVLFKTPYAKDGFLNKIRPFAQSIPMEGLV
jgi:hypothetical protein